MCDKYTMKYFKSVDAVIDMPDVPKKINHDTLEEL